MPVMRERVPLDAIREDERKGGPITSIESTITTDRQGVEKRRPSPATMMTYLGKLEDVNPERHLDSTTVCQVAIARLLGPMVMHRKNIGAFLESEDLQTSQFAFKRIVIDWPRSEDEVKPPPSMTIEADGESTYANTDFGTSLVEETEGVYGPPGSILRKMSHVTTTYKVHMLFAHKEERRAAQAAIERDMLGEPDDDEGHRKIVIPEYFDRTVRAMVRTLARPDTSQGALANEWELQMMIDCSVDVVKLVKTPGRIQPPSTNVELGTDVVPESS